MVKIEAFLRPAALDRVQEALHSIGIVGMSVMRCAGLDANEGTERSIVVQSIKWIIFQK
jgi:nitrogen regulatory protein PII